MSRLSTLLEKTTVRLFLSPHAIEYTKALVDVIRACFKEIQIAHIPFDSDIMIVHITDLRQTPISSSSYLIILSGEPWELSTKVDMAISPFHGQLADHAIYYPFLYSSLFERKLQSFPITKKKHFCAFMYYQSYPHRDRYFHLLSVYKPVTSLGRACSTKNMPHTRFVNNETETYNDIAVRLYASFKFVLAVENTWKPGYVTEKLINPIIANSVPLYWGHPSAFEYINKKRVVYLPEFTDSSIIEYLSTMTEETYQSILNEPWYTDKGKPEKIQSDLEQSIRSILVKK